MPVVLAAANPKSNPAKRDFTAVLVPTKVPSAKRAIASAPKRIPRCSSVKATHWRAVTIVTAITTNAPPRYPAISAKTLFRESDGSSVDSY